MSASRRQFLGAVASSTVAAAQDRKAVSTRPNILHLMVDQMQGAAIANRSECRTPNVNRLAAGGIRFGRAYTPVSLCCPTRAMLLTGAYPWHNGVYTDVISPTATTRDIAPGVVGFPQRLAEVGYRQGYVGKWHASNLRTPLDFGYNEIAAPSNCNPRLLRGIEINPDHVPPLSRGKLKHHVDRWFRWPGSDPFQMWGYVEGPEEETECYWIAENGIRMLKRFSARPEPWHIEIHFHTPHDPYMPLKKYLDRYDPAAIPVPQSFYDTFQGKPDVHRRESETWGEISEDDYKQGRAHYYAACEEVDAQVGRILDALESSGQAENTLVTFSSDHGDMVGAHRMWIKDWIPYEECHRIPMVLRWPARIRPGLTSDRLVQLHDLAYTYVEAAGAGGLSYNEGRSLLPLAANNERVDWPDQILHVYYGDELYLSQRIAVTDRYKYVFNGVVPDECYDLQDDPEEMHNLVRDPARREVVDDMRARLWELMDQYGDPNGRVGPKLPDSGGQNRYCAARYLPLGKRSTKGL